MIKGLSFMFAAAVVLAPVGCARSDDATTSSGKDTEVNAAEPSAVGDWQAIAEAAGITRAKLQVSHGVLFARTDVVRRSGDQGASFEPLDFGPLSEQVHGGNLSSIQRSVVVDPSNADVLYRGTGAKVERSTDGGRTFATLLDGSTLPPKNDSVGSGGPLAGEWVSRIAVSPVDANVVYAVLESGSWGLASAPNVWLMRTTDGGATWTDVVLPTDVRTRAFFAADVLAPHPTERDGFFVLHPNMTSGRDTGHSLMASHDGGATIVTAVQTVGQYFKNVVRGANDAVVAFHDADPRAQAGKACARDAGGAVLGCVGLPGMSGGSFPVPNSARLVDAASDPETGAIYMAVSPGFRELPDGKVETAGSTIYVSHDGAATWTATTPFGFPAVTSLAVDTTSHVAYAATDAGIFKAATR